MTELLIEMIDDYKEFIDRAEEFIERAKDVSTENHGSSYPGDSAD